MSPWSKQTRWPFNICSIFVPWKQTQKNCRLLDINQMLFRHRWWEGKNNVNELCGNESATGSCSLCNMPAFCMQPIGSAEMQIERLMTWPSHRGAYLHLLEGWKDGKRDKKSSRCLTEILECQVKMAARFHLAVLRDIWLRLLTQSPSNIDWEISETFLVSKHNSQDTMWPYLTRGNTGILCPLALSYLLLKV